MCMRTLGLVTLSLLWLAALVLGPQPAAPQVLPDCWDLTYGALHHRAAAPHPPFIVYNTHEVITEQGEPLLDTRESVTYRDDGVARITDDRFAAIPYVTKALDPGPPELGPYGNRRSTWLPVPSGADPLLREIGRVRTKNASGISCSTQGVETYKDRETYRIDFTTAHPEKPALKSLWVDTRNGEIWKVVLSGSLPLELGDVTLSRLTDFEVELTQIGRYVVVDHVTWKYRYDQFSQSAKFFGEYYNSGFAFPEILPASEFS